ncbi:MAG TPA: 1-(5-phosphoribosyl)-5-[(5-phosphoribosylamino)methylideneamino]imidazole-4-carboxamide isomerase [Ktedonobacteraceae bacterium]|nr:1-(5-phosphoribosyl)-5-[(5-phosphoribosylamino)methylideneamino]imidazole-4-carboxamide isomerase [Ktedonobacteraceae bacterium]
MILFPAIDIKDGKCVRLYQGDFDRLTTYDADPVQVARRWQDAGASWLHIVDLDGAITGQPTNFEIIARICKGVSLHIEYGGGMRTLADMQRMLDIGIDRVVLGTIAITNQTLLQEGLQRWPERITVGLDARDGRVAIAGWRETSQIRATTLAGELCVSGVQRFIYTDIARDGALQGPNLPGLQAMQAAISSAPQRSALIASGGISAIDDLRAIAKLGIEGAIVGKALYSGAIDLATAIQVCERESYVD